jgi:NAD(P)-dependent dehydrogenase (short-subunit alcohol dehydrogenase family)
MTCTKRHAVVTGASSGIGRATALRMIAAGWHVYAGVRHPDDAQSLLAEAAGTVSPILLDVTTPEQIKAAVETVTHHAGAAGLDGLVDNAGIGVAGPLELIPLETVRRQFEVNVFGQIAVTQAFLPLLRRARGRIVVIGSIGDRITMPFGGPLAASKAAIASLADAFRMELAPFGVRVVLIEPASIHTEAINKLERDAERAVGEFPADLAPLYQDTYRGVIRFVVARERRGSPPEVVAKVVVDSLTTRRPRARYLVGKDAYRLATISRLPTSVLDALRRRLFGLPAPDSRQEGRS